LILEKDLKAELVKVEKKIDSSRVIRVRSRCKPVIVFYCQLYRSIFRTKKQQRLHPLMKPASYISISTCRDLCGHRVWRDTASLSVGETAGGSVGGGFEGAARQGAS
jgi:hypothetical protein